MHPKCVESVNAAARALGRASLSQSQLDAIEAQLSATMRRLARTDQKRWASMTADQRMAEAGAAAMQDIHAAAARKLENAHRQILKQAETEQRIKTLQDSFKGTPGHDGTRAEALKRDFELSHIMATAERKIAMGNLVDLIEASGEQKGVGLGRRALMTVVDAENPLMTRDIVREIFRRADGSTGNAAASGAGKAWLESMETLRGRFNAAGGDVGRLGYGWVPQPWETASIRRVKADAFADDVLPHVDRSRYLREDGSRMSDGDLRATLAATHETLATEGLNELVPGSFRSAGAVANRHAESRQIHFADGDGYLAVMGKYGSGSVYNAMMGHLGRITRDITLVERYGPDADATARLQFDHAAIEDRTSVDKLVGTMSVNPQTYWKMITGAVGTPVDEALARRVQTVRNLVSAAKLGKAVIHSFGDIATMINTTGYNRLPYWQLMKDVGQAATPEWLAKVGVSTGRDAREFMSAHGMIAESLASSVNRWSGDHLSSDWSGRLSNATMRAQLLNAWTDGLRQGFTMSMNAGLARMAKTDWHALNAFDRSRLTRAGFGEADWRTLGGVAPTRFKGRDLLTPQSVKDANVPGGSALAAKLFGFIHDESEYAVVNPDLRARAITTAGGLQAGTVPGEIVRTAMQFKSFPIAMATRHWARMLESDHGVAGAPALANRWVYAMTLLPTLTLLGAVSFQADQLLFGRDPIDMENPRFWLKAVAVGGGFSIAGDLFLIDPTTSYGDSSANLAKNLLGPTFGAVVGDVGMKLIVENAWQSAAGKDTHWEAELLSWAQSETPGGNLWWVKPAIDHGFMNALNENLSPGYLSRMKQRAAKDWHTGYWWSPDQSLPQRAPDLAKAVGQ